MFTIKHKMHVIMLCLLAIAFGAQTGCDEGEGDRSLANWRAGHWNFFTGECEALGQQPREAMPVVCERFRVIYRSAEKYT